MHAIDVDTREHQGQRAKGHCYTARRYTPMIRQEPRAVFAFSELCTRVVIGGRHCEDAREAENSAPARTDLEVGGDTRDGADERARARADLLTRSLVAADRGILTIA